MAAVSLTVICGDGNEAKFWTDSWSSVGPLNLFAPNLFGSVSRAGKRRSVRAAIAQRQWARDIVGATTTQVILQYLQVWNIAESVQLDPLSVDRFVWKWSPDGNYSASSTYRAFFHGSAAMLGARELWKTKAPPKVKFFVWLMLHRRLWTGDRRRRHGLQDHDLCAFFSQEAETVEHLVLGCYLSRGLWFALLRPLGMHSRMPAAAQDIGEWWIDERRNLQQGEQAGFDCLFMLIAWNIWKHRNGLVFESWPRPCLERLKRDTVAEADQWLQAGYRALGPLCAAWSRDSAVM